MLIFLPDLNAVEEIDSPTSFWTFWGVRPRRLLVVRSGNAGRGGQYGILAWLHFIVPSDSIGTRWRFPKTVAAIVEGYLGQERLWEEDTQQVRGREEGGEAGRVSSRVRRVPI